MSDVMEFVQNEDGTFSAYDDTYDIVIHCETENEQKKVIERLESTNWIPVSERLPEECVPVNIVWTNRNPETYYSKIKNVPFSATGVYYNGNWYWYSSTCVDYLAEYGKCERDLVDKAVDITHWQPLPEPPHMED